MSNVSYILSLIRQDKIRQVAKGDRFKPTWWRGLPTMEGKTARGASSPANPALTKPEPLSHTRAVVSSSSHMIRLYWGGLKLTGADIQVKV